MKFISVPDIEPSELAEGQPFTFALFCQVRPSIDLKGIDELRAERKPVLIDFWADWCQACKELDVAVYPTALFKAEATRFVLAKADMTKGDDATDALAARFGIGGLPAVVFVTSDGTVLPDPRVLGLVPPERMVEAMRRVR